MRESLSKPTQPTGNSERPFSNLSNIYSTAKIRNDIPQTTLKQQNLSQTKHFESHVYYDYPDEITTFNVQALDTQRSESFAIDLPMNLGLPADI